MRYRLGAVMLALLLLPVWALAGDAAQESCIGFARVLRDQVNLRESAGAGGDRVRWLEAGETVFVHGEVAAGGAAWYRVSVPRPRSGETQYGYVRGDMLALTRELFTDLIAVDAGYSHTVGLQADGTVLSIGHNWWEQQSSLPEGEKHPAVASGWRDIVAIAALDHTTLALTAGGELLGAGRYARQDLYRPTGAWPLVSLDATQYLAWGLAADGALGLLTTALWAEPYGSYSDYLGGYTLAQLPPFAGVCATAYALAGVTRDGGVVAFGRDTYGQLDLGPAWAGTADILMGETHTVGLRADGTVVAAGSNAFGQCEVGGWQDVTAIAVGAFHTLGLKADGTVVAAGINDQGQCDVGGWHGITQIDAVGSLSLGITQAGTLIVCGAPVLHYTTEGMAATRATEVNGGMNVRQYDPAAIIR